MMNKQKMRRLLVLLLLTPTIVSQVSIAPLGHSADYPVFERPKTLIDLTSLIDVTPLTSQKQFERSDASDMYRGPGEPVINDPFKVNGVVRGFISVTSFQKFALTPSKVIGTSKEGDYQNIGAYYASLPPCFEPEQSDCIFDFSLKDSTGRVIKAKPFAALPFVTKYPDILDAYERYPDFISVRYGTFSGKKEFNLPSGGENWIWNVPDLEPGERSLYSASVALSGNRISSPSKIEFFNPSAKLQITPVDVSLPICESNSLPGCQWRDIRIGLDGGIFDSEKMSIKRSANAFSGSYKLGFRLSVPWTSWLISTVTGVSIETSKLGESYIYEISGEPSLIPTVRKWVPVSDSNKIQLNSLVNGDPCSYQPTQCAPIIKIGGSYVTDTSFSMLEKAEQLSDSRATFTTKSWMVMNADKITNLPSKIPDTELQICAKKFAIDRPAGITGSNATVFQHTPPAWDKVSRTFSYQVGSFKLAPEGSEFLGDYSLLVSTDVARCLWGSDIGAAQAILQVLNGSGEAQVATTVVNSDSKWFRFRASGFHFSSPKLVASIAKNIQPTPSPSKPSEAASSPSAKPTLSARVVIKKTTITCTKGKVAKKIFGLNPKCPSGYNKK